MRVQRTLRPEPVGKLQAPLSPGGRFVGDTDSRLLRFPISLGRVRRRVDGRALETVVQGQRGQPVLSRDDDRSPLDAPCRLDQLRRPGQACPARIDRPKSQLQRGRIGFQPEVEAGRVDEPGVGDDRVYVQPLCLPLLEAHVPQERDRLSLGVPVHVGVRLHGLVAHEQLPLVVVDDVLLEAEARILVASAQVDLVVAPQGEDVVARHEVLPVVNAQPGGRRAVGDVVFDEDLRASLVGVDAAGAGAFFPVPDVVDQVAAYDRAGRYAERVDPAHVAELAGTDVVHVVVLDAVAVGLGRGVAPTPAAGDARVVQVADLVMRDDVVAALADPHADRPVEDPADVVNEVAHELVAPGLGGLARRDPRVADLHAARRQVVEVVLDNPVVPAAVPKGDRIAAEVGELAPLDRAPPRADRIENGGHGNRRLPVGVALRPQNVVGVLKRESPKVYVLDELALLRIAGQESQLHEHGRDDCGLAHVLARARPVGEPTFVVVQIPLAGSVQRLQDVFHVVALPTPEGPFELAGEGDGMGRLVDGLDPEDAGFPVVEGDHAGVAKVAPPLDVARPEAKARLRGVALLSRGRIDRRRGPPDDAKEALVRGSRQHGAPAAHPQLPQRPLAPLGLRHVDHPKPGALACATGDGTAAGNHWPGSRHGGIRDRTLGRAGVLRFEHKRLRQPVGSLCQEHRDGLAQGCACFQGADRAARRAERRQRPVALVGVGLGQCARPAIVPLRGNVKGCPQGTRANQRGQDRLREQRRREGPFRWHGLLPSVLGRRVVPWWVCCVAGRAPWLHTGPRQFSALVLYPPSRRRGNIWHPRNPQTVDFRGPSG